MPGNQIINDWKDTNNGLGSNMKSQSWCRSFNDLTGRCEGPCQESRNDDVKVDEKEWKLYCKGKKISTLYPFKSQWSQLKPIDTILSAFISFAMHASWGWLLLIVIHHLHYRYVGGCYQHHHQSQAQQRWSWPQRRFFALHQFALLSSHQYLR